MSLYEHCIRYYSINKFRMNREFFNLPQEILIDIMIYETNVSVNTKILERLCDIKWFPNIVVYKKTKINEQCNHRFKKRGLIIKYYCDKFRARIYGVMRVNSNGPETIKIYGDFFYLKVFLPRLDAELDNYAIHVI